MVVGEQGNQVPTTYLFGNQKVLQQGYAEAIQNQLLDRHRRHIVPLLEDPPGGVRTLACFHDYALMPRQIFRCFRHTPPLDVITARIRSQHLIPEPAAHHRRFGQQPENNGHVEIFTHNLKRSLPQDQVERDQRVLLPKPGTDKLTGRNC